MKNKKYAQKISLLNKFLLICLFAVSGLWSTVLKAQVDVTATGGTLSAPYTTLGAAFSAINAGTHTGVITIAISANSTEAGPCVLNSSGAGAASYSSILIKPTTVATISGATATGRGLIELNGADNVTIDGAISGTSRDLIITNTAANTLAYTAVIRIASSTLISTNDNNTIKNCILNGSATGRNISSVTSETINFGIVVSGNASTTSATTAPSALTSGTTTVASPQTVLNFTVLNNQINKCGRGISFNGSALTVCPVLTISNNSIGNPVAADPDQVYKIGITAQGFNTGSVISGNSIYVESYYSTSCFGIDLGFISTSGAGAVIEKNTIGRVYNRNTSGYGVFGINLLTTTTSTNHIIQNNFVSNLMAFYNNSATNTTFGPKGIRIAGGTGHKIYHNTVSLYGSPFGSSAADLSACLVSTSSSWTSLDIRNNIFSNTISGSPAGSVDCAIFLPSGMSSSTNQIINNNAYYVGTSTNSYLASTGTTYTVANFNSSVTTPATNWRAYTNGLNTLLTNDNASIATIAAAPFFSATNLHINSVTPSQLESGGASVGVTTDFDGQNRPGPLGSVNGGGTAPDMGADEFDGAPLSPPTISNVTITPTGNACAATLRTITAIVVPNSGTTASVLLNYSLNGVAQPAISMINTSGNTWSASIAATTSSVNWSITATNTGGLSNNIIGTGYKDDPFAGVTLQALANPTAVCSGSSVNLSVTIAMALRETFEATSFPLTSFAVAATSGTYTGVQSTTLFSEGLSSIRFNTASASASGTLTNTANLNLTGLSNLQLSFKHITAMEGPSTSYDFGYVEYSVDGGTNWITFPQSSYVGSASSSVFTGGNVRFSTMSYPNWISAFTSTSSVPTNSHWQTEVFNIPASALSSTQFKIRFRYTTDSGTNYYGWMIDDVKISPPANFTSYNWTSTPAGFTSAIQNPVASPTGNTTYSVIASDVNGCSLTANTAQVSIIPAPPVPSISGILSVCGNGTTTLTATPSVPGNTISWFDVATGGIALFTGPAFTTPVINANKIFYAQENDAQCSSSRTPVTVTWSAGPVVTFQQGNNLTICPGNSQTFTALPGGNGETYLWSPNAGSSTNQSISVNSAGSYTVTVTNSGGCASSASATLNYSPAPVVSAVASPGVVCAGSTVNLTGNAFGPYFGESFEAASFPLTSFAVAATSGTYTGVQSTTLFAEGLSSIRFNTASTSASGTLTNTANLNLTGFSVLQLSFKHIAAMESPTTSYDFGYVEYSVDGGASWITFPQSSYVGSASSSVFTGGNVRFSTMSYPNWISAFTSGTSVPTNSQWQTEVFNIPAAALSSTQFKIRFRYTTDSSTNYYGWMIDDVKILGNIPGTYSWTSTPAGFTASSLNTTATPSVSTTYNLSVTDGIGCNFSASTAQVTVNPVPPAPSISGILTVCGNGTTTLTATPSVPGNTISWFDVATGGTALFTGPTFTTPVINANKIFYAQENGTLCTSSRTPVTVTWSAGPVVTFQQGNSITLCPGSSQTFTALPGGNGETYLWSPNAGSSTNQSITVNSAGSYTVTVTNTGGCASSETATLNYSPEPVVSAVASPGVVCAGSTVNLTGSALVPSFGENFEAASFPLTSFSVNNITGTFTATQNATYFAEGSNSVLFKTVSTSANGALSNTSNVNLSAYTNAQLTFKHIAALEGYLSSFDFGYVEYSSNGGSTWTTFPQSSYAGSASASVFTGTDTRFSTLSYPNWVTALQSASALPTNALWQSETFNIPASALTSQFRIRFRITTDGSVSYYGWLLDDIKISVNVPGTYSWTSTPAGFTASSLNTTATPSVSTTYNLSVTDGIGCNFSASTAQVTVNPVPSAPTVSGNTSVCGIATTTLTSSLSVPGNNITWFDVSTGGTALFTGTSFTTPVLTASKTFYAQENNAFCNSPRTSVTVTWNAAPSLAIYNFTNNNTSNVIFCGTTGVPVVNLDATTGSAPSWAANGSTYFWSQSTTGGLSCVGSCASTNSVDLNNIFPAQTSENIDVTVTDPVSGCVSKASVNINAFDFPGFNATATPPNLCTGQSTQLSTGVSSQNFVVTSVPYSPVPNPGSSTVLCSGGVENVPLSLGATLTLDDAGWANVPLGFNFNFFGNVYSTVNVGCNGNLQFGSTANFSTSYTPGPIPAGSVPNNFVAACWSDMLFTVSGSIEYYVSGVAPTRVFVITWDGPMFGNTSAHTKSQALLYESTGVVEVHLLESNGLASLSTGKTIGVEDLTGVIGAAAPGRNGTAWSTSAPEAWRFQPPVNYSFVWSTIPASGFSSTLAEPVVTPTAGTTYQVTVTDPITGCVKNDDVLVQVNSYPVVNVNPSTSNVCYPSGTQATLTASGDPASYTWSPATGLSATTGNSVDAYPPTSTNYTVTATSPAGCSSTATTTVNVTQAPNVSVTASPNSVCSGGDIQLNAVATTASPYCTATGGTGTYYMNNFSTTGGATNITNNSSGNSPSGYGNYTAMNVTQAVGSSVSWSVSNLTVGTYGIEIYVDWNQNGSLADAGDQVYASGAYLTTATGSFTVPAGAYNGGTRMRVVVDYFNTTPGACDVSTSHETEDYTFIVTGGIPNNTGSFTYDWSANSTFLSATNISNPVAQNITGTQTYDVLVTDLNTTCYNTATVDVIMNPVPLVTFTTDLSNFYCENQNINFDATGTGYGSGTPTYSWTGPGFTAASENPTLYGAQVVNSGAYTVDFTDGNGCTATETQYVEVNPNPLVNVTTTPVSCLNDNNGTATFDITVQPTYNDYAILEGSNTGSGNPTTFTGYVDGTYFYQVSELNTGCTSFGSFAVTTVPNVDPVIICPANITVPNTPGSCGAYVNYTPPVGTDNCSNGLQTTLQAGPAPGGFFPIGTTIVRYRVTDEQMAYTECTFSVIVEDAEAPSYVGSSSCPASFTACNPVTWTAPLFQDNCPGLQVTSSHSPGGNFPIGVTPITYTATDLNGNVTTCSFNVTVLDSSIEATSISSNRDFNNICNGGDVTLTVNGGHLGESAPGVPAQWKWYAGSCGTTLVGTGSSITVSPAATTTYFVRAEGGCRITACVQLTVVVSAAPPSSAPTYTTIPAQGAPGVTGTLSVAPVPNATYYRWFTNNGHINSVLFNGNVGPWETNVPTVNVTFVLPQQNYQLRVIAGNACGRTSQANTTIRGTVPAPTSMTGPIQACPSSPVTYSISAIPNGSPVTYNWTLVPTTAGTITMAANGLSATVVFNAGFGTAQVCANGISSFGLPGPAYCTTVTSSAPVPGAISGNATPCSGNPVPEVYSIAAVPSAISYNWTSSVPGAIVVPAGNGLSASISFPATTFTGTVQVTASSPCGTSAPSTLNVTNGVAGNPGNINGASGGLCGAQDVAFSVATSNALSYLWTVTPGMSIDGPNNLNAVTIDFLSGFTSGTVTVEAFYSCGSVIKTHAVSGTPSAPIVAPAALCANSFQTYFVTNLEPSTDYTWTTSGDILDEYCSFGSASNCSGYYIETGPAGGSFTVTATNSCGTASTTSGPCRVMAESIDMKLYPNPTNGLVTVELYSKMGGTYKVSITDLSGRQVLSQEFKASSGRNQQEIDLGFANAGLYMVYIKDAQGNIGVQKLSVE